MTNGKLGAYVLTIEPEGGQRRQHAERELASLGLPWTFVDGLDASNPSLTEEYSPIKNLLLHKRSLTGGEKAVYAGHRRIWREMLKDGLDFALVLEDDFKVLDRECLARSLDDFRRNPEHWDIVKFFDYRPKNPIAKITVGSTTAVAYKYPASGAVGYLIKADAARALLKRDRIFRPVDEDFSNAWEFSLRIWSTDPNLITEDSSSLGGSILEPDRQAARRTRRVFRSLWGNVLQGAKLLRALMYCRRLSLVSDTLGQSASARYKRWQELFPGFWQRRGVH